MQSVQKEQGGVETTKEASIFVQEGGRDGHINGVRMLGTRNFGSFVYIPLNTPPLHSMSWLLRQFVVFRPMY